MTTNTAAAATATRYRFRVRFRQFYPGDAVPEHFDHGSLDAMLRCHKIEPVPADGAPVDLNPTAGWRPTQPAGEPAPKAPRSPRRQTR